MKIKNKNEKKERKDRYYKLQASGIIAPKDTPMS